MVKIKFNGRELVVEENSTVLEAARQGGVNIPTLCYLKDINEVAACRVCLVEIKGSDRLVAACNTVVRDGMEVVTDSERVFAARRQNVQLILTAHDCNCLTCPRNGTCRLQSLAREMGLLERQPYPVRVPKDSWLASLSLQRRDSKCISCLRCIGVCERMQGLGVWELLGLGRHARVGVSGGRTLADAGCVSCGQCVVNCPVAALVERDDTGRFIAALNDSSRTLAVRLASSSRHLAAGFRRLGVRRILDTSEAEGSSVKETAAELADALERKESAGCAGFPLFTASCPSWVRFAAHEYPALTSCLTKAVSPRPMFGAAAKAGLSETLGEGQRSVRCVSVTPCLAGKPTGDEAADLVLTTREAIALQRRFGVESAVSDDGDEAGDAVRRFDEQGGEAEAVLRETAELLGAGPLGEETLKGLREGGVRRELAVRIGGREVRVCAVAGLAAARRVVEDVVAGRVAYDLVEVMACPGGCTCGDGRPPIGRGDRS